MSWIATGATVGGIATAKLVTAGIQNRRAKKNAEMDEKNRPQYEIPAEIGQNLTQAELSALQGLPEAQKQQYLQNIERGAAYGMSQNASRKGGLSGVANINQNINDAYGNLLSMDSAARMQNQQQVYGMRQNMADYRDQAFQLNKINPYYENIAKRDAREGALFRNIDNTVNLVGGGLLGAVNPMSSLSTKTNSNSPSNNNPYANNSGTYSNPNQNIFSR